MVAFTNAAINKITKLMGAFEKHRSVDTQEVKPRNLAETVEGEREGGGGGERGRGRKERVVPCADELTGLVSSVV